jgi:hypothetical protein
VTVKESVGKVFSETLYHWSSYCEIGHKVTKRRKKEEEDVQYLSSVSIPLRRICESD